MLHSRAKDEAVRRAFVKNNPLAPPPATFRALSPSQKTYSHRHVNSCFLRVTGVLWFELRDARHVQTASTEVCASHKRQGRARRVRGKKLERETAWTRQLPSVPLTRQHAESNSRSVAPGPTAEWCRATWSWNDSGEIASDVSMRMLRNVQCVDSPLTHVDDNDSAATSENVPPPRLARQAVRTSGSGGAVPPGHVAQRQSPRPSVKRAFAAAPLRWARRLARASPAMS
jgi:hypothetical protein